MRVLITGGTGFLGRHLVNHLEEQGVGVGVLRREQHDLLHRIPGWRARGMLKDVSCVIHAAGTVSGIGRISKFPAHHFADNMKMGMNIIDAVCAIPLSHRPKLVFVGTACSYPELAPVPTVEANLWEGYPEPTNGPYGVAKRALLSYLYACRKQYGLEFSYPILANMYGPGDNFEDGSHVIPALISKFVRAKDENLPFVTVWGNGRAERDFLYVEDAVAGILLIAQGDALNRPINLSTGQSITISNLARMIASIVEYEGEISFDASKPNGQMKRGLSPSLARSMLAWQSEVVLEEGLKRTIEWYKGRRNDQ